MTFCGSQRVPSLLNPCSACSIVMPDQAAPEMSSPPAVVGGEIGCITMFAQTAARWSPVQRSCTFEPELVLVNPLVAGSTAVFDPPPLFQTLPAPAGDGV